MSAALRLPRPLLILCAVGLLLSCDSDLPTAGQVGPRGALGPAVLIPTEDSFPAYELVDSFALVVTDTTELIGERELGAITNSSGPIVLEIEGTAALRGVPISLGEIINSNGILYYEHVMLVLRTGQLRALESPPTEEALSIPQGPPGYVTYIARAGVVLDFMLKPPLTDEFQTVVPEAVESSTNRVRFVLDSASRGLLSVRWNLNSYGQSYDPTGYPADCLPIHARCVAFPPSTREYTIDGPSDVPRASANLMVRVYRAQGVVSRLSVSRASVLPVITLSGFNADSQVIRNGPQARHDTVYVTIPGLPIGSSIDRFVFLDSRPQRRTGGHRHNGATGVERRPEGSFFTLDQLGNVSAPDGGERGRLRVRRPYGRDTTVVYRSSGVGGVDWIVLSQRTDVAPLPLDSVAVNVTVPGLVRIEQNQHFFYAGSQNHGTQDRYLQPGVLEVLNDVLGQWRELNRRDPDRHPMANADREFQIDAFSLPNGGLHDVAGTWGAGRIGHVLHRDGLDIDVNDREVEDTMPRVLPDGTRLTSPSSRFVALCEERTFTVGLGVYPLACEPHGRGTNVHFHILMVPQRDRAAMPWRQQ